MSLAFGKETQKRATPAPPNKKNPTHTKGGGGKRTLMVNDRMSEKPREGGKKEKKRTAINIAANNKSRLYHYWDGQASWLAWDKLSHSDQLILGQEGVLGSDSV